MLNGIHMLTVGHVLFKGFSVCIKFVNSIQEFFISDLFFFKNHTVSLFFKGTGIQNLITSAGIGRKWDQKVGFMKGAEFADRVGTCSGLWFPEEIHPFCPYRRDGLPGSLSEVQEGSCERVHLQMLHPGFHR